MYDCEDATTRESWRKASTVGLHAKWLKTKVQNIGSGPTPNQVSMGNQIVEPVNPFTYLGSDVEFDGYSIPRN